MPDTPPPAPLRITAEELSRAVPAAGPPAAPPRTSQLAVASLVLGLLGIPLVGLLLGPIAIVCGAMAIPAIQERDRLRGLRLAIWGVVLGTLDLIGWTVGLLWLLSRPVVTPPVQPDQREASAPLAAGVADAPPHIRRALQANLLVRCRDGRGGEGLGSGVVVGRAGTAAWVLTNRHVVDCGGSQELTAAAVGGQARPAAVAWRAPEGIDAVVLRVEGAGEPPQPAPLRADAPPRVGDPVFAVGNPLGYEATFTAGVLSAMRQASYGARRLRVFQVQAAVNPGHSGGGLYDAGGHLIGLNTWTADKGRSEGIGFAVSTEELLALVRETAAPELVAALGDGPARDPSRGPAKGGSAP